MGSTRVSEKIEDKVKRWSICIVIVATIMAIYCISYTIRYEVQTEKGEKLRIQYAQAVVDAENREYKSLEQYEYIIADIEGKIIHTNSTLYKQGENINLHMLSTKDISSVDRKAAVFISPLVNEGRQWGTLMISIANKDIIHNIRIKPRDIIPLIGLIIICYCIIKLQGYIVRKLVAPIKQATDIARDILKGDYAKVITCEDKNEMGQLFQEMELLRDELLNSSIQAQRSNENEKMIAACISHDLKTPIATISGCAEAIRDGIAKTPSDVDQYIKIILNKTKLLTKLVNEILEHANAELDQLILTRQEVYAKEFIHDVYIELLPDAQSKGIKLELESVPDVLLDIAPERIFQVFQNIIGNSIKYTPQGGRICIKFEIYNEWLAVEIIDNGEGIKAIDIPFIFERFYRGEKARTQKEVSGSGLGLSIVRNIIERHGGRIECDSILGEGTTMRFLLPLSK